MTQAARPQGLKGGLSRLRREAVEGLAGDIFQRADHGSTAFRPMASISHPGGSRAPGRASLTSRTASPSTTRDVSTFVIE